MKCIQRLRGYFGAKYAGTLTLDNCDEYRRWRADGGYIWQQCGHERRSKGGNRIVDIELQVLGNALALAARRGKLKANPLAGRQRYHREEDTTHCREKAPAPEQLENIVQTLRVRGQGSVADCIMFLALSGLRVNEALRLAWDEVDWQAGIVNVQREKRGINPWIEVHPEMRRLLRQMWARHKSQWLFPSVLDAERPLSYATVATTLARTWRSLGMGCITLHGLRSFFVTQCRESGMSDVEIAAAIGDRSGAAIIARTYGDVRPERLRKQLRDVIFVGTKGDETEAEPQSEAGSVPQRQVAA
jgi:integrase